MNQEIKQQWTQALRSGTYQQVRGNMRIHDGYCVLGVLCDLHSQATGTRWGKEENPISNDGAYHYRFQYYCPDVGIRDWAGIKADDTEVLSKLTSCNDHGMSFTALADIIDANL